MISMLKDKSQSIKPNKISASMSFLKLFPYHVLKVLGNKGTPDNTTMKQ